MSETVNQAADTAAQAAQNAQGAEKTFTQSEVNQIVADRLQRERAKYEGFDDFKAKAERLDAMEEASKTELQKATDKAARLQAELDGLKKANSVRAIREKVAADNKIPVSLLTGETEEACTEQAKAILAFARPDSYPNLRDGGEVQGAHTGGKFGAWGPVLDQMKNK
jgi:hypothetical protein